MNADEIFTSALEIPSGPQRESFLDQACAGNAQLRQEIESLLQSYEAAGNFLAEPIIQSDSTESSPADERLVGTTVGLYKLQQLIGRGGMGLVFAAQQLEPLRRQVAVKLIKSEFASRNVTARFDAERQALAILDHPNIARVIDAGVTDRGQPYFVMELVKGLPITEYCDQARLNPRQRIELMIPVCQAIQHAHQKGIIHRDLKPSNVLVTEYDGAPVPKVIDFGVAKAVDFKLTDMTLNTDFGAVVGTLEYMSPEQAGLNQLDIDTRSDVYSLGVLLYELLTGSTPVNRSQLGEAAILEALRIIREEDPDRPSTRISSTEQAPSIAANRSIEPARLTGLVRGDLDWIAMKSLEKDRAQRYQTALELGEDLQRFLKSETVLAGPPSKIYRIRKFLRRNRLGVSLVVLLLVALMAGTVGTTIGMLQAIKEGRLKSQALEQLRLENEEKTRALAAEQLARQQADIATDRAVNALQSLTDDAVQRLMAAEPNLSSANREFLNQIVQQLAEFTQVSNQSVKARVVQADGLNQIGNLKGRLGDTSGAITSFRESIALWKPLCQERPDKPEYRRGMADAFSNLGIHLATDRQFEESEQSHRQAIEVHDSLALEFPDNLGYLRNSANVRNSYGVMLKDVGRNQETMQQYEQSIAIYQRVLEKEPDNTDTLISLTNVQNNYAIELFLAGQADKSIAANEELIQTRQRLAELPTSGPRERYLLAMTMGNLAMALRSTKRIDEALDWLQRADPIAGRAVSEHPAVVEYREGYSNLLNQLAAIYSSKKMSQQGIATNQRAAQLLSQLVRDFPGRADLAARLANVNALMGLAQQRSNDVQGSLQSYEAAIASARKAVQLAPKGRDYRFQLGNLLILSANARKKSDNQEDMELLYSEARTILTALLMDHPEDQPAKQLLDSIATSDQDDTESP